MPDKFKSRAAFAIAAGVAAIVALTIVWNGRYILLLLFAGIVGALLLSLPAQWLQARLKVPRSVALLIVLLATAAVLAGLVMLRGQALLQQMSTLGRDLPQAAREIVARLNSVSWGRWLIGQIAGSSHLPESFSVAVSGLRGAFTAGTFTAAALILVVFTSLFLAAEPEFYLSLLFRLTPVQHRPLLARCLTAARASLELWLFAKLLSMVIIGSMVALGLWILRIPLPGTLGMIAGLLTFIPNVGPIVSVIPAALLAFAVSPGRGVLTLLLFGLVHFLEGNVVTPLAERKIVTLPPALTLSVQLLLASVTGVLGIAIAAPITAVLLGIMNAGLSPDDKTEAAIQPLSQTIRAPGHRWPPAAPQLLNVRRTKGVRTASRLRSRWSRERYTDLARPVQGSSPKVEDRPHRPSSSFASRFSEQPESRV
jgi:predicted PurR-regulated permease PerM